MESGCAGTDGDLALLEQAPGVLSVEQAGERAHKAAAVLHLETEDDSDQDDFTSPGTVRTSDGFGSAGRILHGKRLRCEAAAKWPSAAKPGRSYGVLYVLLSLSWGTHPTLTPLNPDPPDP